MSSVLSTVGRFNQAEPVPSTRAPRDWRSRMAARLGLWRSVLGREGLESAVQEAPAALPVYAMRPTGDVLAGQPAVVIPLNRAVVCGEDHVYDVAQFSVCPNCAAEERLSLVELLGHGRRRVIPISR